MTKKRLPKIGYRSADSSVPRGSDGTDIFPRSEHPDQRSAATWLKQHEERMRERHKPESRWYPKTKKPC